MKDKDISLQDIIKARDKCAAIIAQYGRAYLPVFERLEKEIQVREQEERLFQKAIEISTQNSTPFSTQNDHQNNMEN